VQVQVQVQVQIQKQKQKQKRKGFCDYPLCIYALIMDISTINQIHESTRLQPASWRIRAGK
jgi:hypothetical protein